MNKLFEEQTAVQTDSGKNLSSRNPVLYWLWNVVILLCAGIGIGLVSLTLAYGNYSWDVFLGYFNHPLIAFLNILPCVLLVFFFWFLTGRPWVGFLLTAVLVLSASIGSYFKLLFRDDPFVAADFSSITTAMGVAGNYDLRMDKRLWFLLACVVLGTVFLRLLVRGKPGRPVRLAGAAAVLLSVWPLWSCVYSNNTIYEQKARNDEHIVQWSATQSMISRGFVYPFLHSISAAVDTPPEGYSHKAAEELLSQYTDEEIPADKKVNIIGFQLEAFNDFTNLGIKGISNDVYAAYHQIEAESYTGNLVTNIFAGGTIDSERCALTGYYQLRDFRKNTNSYVWYLRDQGYRTTGSHPCYEWFYNRRNIMPWLGFEEYLFLNDHYAELTGGAIAYDQVALPEMLRLYQEAAAEGQPVFDFNITYQGHGPYTTDAVEWGGGAWDPTGYYENVSDYDYNVMNNYLGSVRDTGNRMLEFLNALRYDETPVVVVFWGDHNPWLGDSGCVYTDLGVNLDTQTEEGFYNYYSTRYVMWANEAAKQVLGNDFQGEGPDLSSNYLMNELFRQLGWKGNAYMQLTEEIRQTLPIVNSNGFYVENGTVKSAEELSETGAQALRNLRIAQYAVRKNFDHETE